MSKFFAVFTSFFLVNDKKIIQRKQKQLKQENQYNSMSYTRCVARYTQSVLQV